MKRVLGPNDFRAMPWANGKGTTLELARADRDGRLLWRLSQAAVVEDGPFSSLPGIARNLTVIGGPGFDLVGEGLRLHARPWQPLAFSGGLALSAAGVDSPSEDFNVMTASDLPPARVEVLRGPVRLDPQGGLLALYRPAAQLLCLTDGALDHQGGEAALAVWIAVRS